MKKNHADHERFENQMKFVITFINETILLNTNVSKIGEIKVE